MNKLDELESELKGLDAKRHKIQKDILTIKTLNKNKAMINNCMNDPVRYDSKIIITDKFDSSKGCDVYIPIDLSNEILTSIILWLESKRK